MKGHDFVAFASKVAALHHEEAARRSVISRAYYGALHASLDFLRGLGLPIDTRHDNAAIDFKSSLVADGVRIGRLLDRLREARVKADYRIADESVCPPANVLSSVERANEILEVLEALQQQLTQFPAQQNAFVAEIRAARAKTGRRV